MHKARMLNDATLIHATLVMRYYFAELVKTLKINVAKMLSHPQKLVSQNFSKLNVNECPVRKFSDKTGCTIDLGKT